MSKSITCVSANPMNSDFMFSCADSGIVGKIKVAKGVLEFEGNAEASAELFLKFLKQRCLSEWADLQQKLDALASENSTIKTMNDVLSEELRGYESDGAYDGPIAHKLWHSNSKTPATSAYLKSVRADAVQALWDDSLNDVGRVLEEIRAYDDASEAAGIVHSEIQERVRDYAAQLRAGKDGV